MAFAPALDQKIVDDRVSQLLASVEEMGYARAGVLGTIGGEDDGDALMN